MSKTEIKHTTKKKWKIFKQKKNKKKKRNRKCTNKFERKK